MSIFKRNSFDSYTTTGVEIIGGQLVIAAGETFVADSSITSMSSIRASVTTTTDTKLAKKNLRTKLIIGGKVEAQFIEVPNVVVTGTIKAKILRVEGVLAVKAGAKIEADVVMYRELVVETGAIILARMQHLDHADPFIKTFIEP